MENTLQHFITEEEKNVISLVLLFLVSVKMKQMTYMLIALKI